MILQVAKYTPNGTHTNTHRAEKSTQVLDFWDVLKQFLEKQTPWQGRVFSFSSHSFVDPALSCVLFGGLLTKMKKILHGQTLKKKLNCNDAFFGFHTPLAAVETNGDHFFHVA